PTSADVEHLSTRDTLLVDSEASMESKASSSFKYIRWLLRRDWGGTCGTSRSVRDSVLFMRLSISPSWIHMRCKAFRGSSLASAFARNIAFMPPAEVPERT